jgi:hypothetical protein
MIGMVVHLVILLVLVLSTDSLARRSYITPEQKTQPAFKPFWFPSWR